jgi:asparagine synthase (glutamine-hydrolysing)
MCGIAGQLSTSHIQPDTQSVLAALAHRGPDVQAFWSLDNICLWHARLSIIDTDARANQPYTDASGRYVLVFNGEIYNYQSLKATLSFDWQTSSDTELLMEWLKAYGHSRLDELEGMFAFAFYDTQNNTCLLARDRFGKKPLYLYQTSEVFSFASEVRVLLKMYPEAAYTTRQQLSNWLYWQTIPGQETLLPDIKQLEPGTYLFWENGVQDKGAFTNWQAPQIALQNEEELLGELKHLVAAAVEKRLVADVPFATFLSGGVDSSIITALAAQQLGSSLNTFTVSFDEAAFSEHHIAAEVAKRYGTQHHEIWLTPQDFLKEIEAGLAATDHPSGDGLNTYVVSKHTQAAGFKMALSGIGGDEWFLGYNYFTALDALKKKQALGFLKAFSGVLPLRYRKAMDVLANLDKGAAAYAYQRILFDQYTVQKAFGLPLPSLLPKEGVWPDNMSARSVEEWRYYTQPVLLRDSDQYSMAVGLELRAPFMDQDVVNFALSLPDELKRGTRSKYLLIEAFKDLLPTNVYDRKKQGFTLPWEQWMRHELKDFCQTRITAFAQRIDAPQLNTEWEQFLMGRGQWTWSRLWSIVALEDYLLRNEITVRA